MAIKMKLTKAAVEAIEPPQKGRVEVWDSEVPGLCIRVTAKGARSWCLVKRLKGGRPVRITLGRFPVMTPDVARKQAFRELAAIADGENPAAARRSVRAEMTLGDLFDRYLEEWARPRKRTADEDEARWRLHLARWNGRKLSDLTAAEVGQWHHRTAKERGVYAANRAHSLLRKVYAFAEAQGYEGTNPASKVQQLPEESRERFLQPEEMPRFLDALRTMEERTFRDFIALLLMTSQRRGVVSAMRWDALNLDRGEWSLSAAETKNKKPLKVPLIPPAIALLRERREVVPTKVTWVLPSPKKAGAHYSEPKKAWAALMDRVHLLALAEAIAERTEQQPNAVRAIALDWMHERTREQLSRAGKAKGKATGKNSLPAVQQAVEEFSKRLTDAGGDPEAARPEPLRIHDLRRTAASFMAMAGVPLHTIGKALGHDSTHATPIYARLNLDAQRVALAQAFDAMSGGK